MGITDRIQKIFTPTNRGTTVDYTSSVGLPYGYNTSPISIQNSMQLSTVYRCVEVISDSIATETFDIMEYGEDNGWVKNPFHKSAYMLNVEPHPNMGRYTFMKTLISKILLEGNGYVIIQRDSRGDPLKLELVTTNVSIFRRKDGGLYYEVGEAARIIEDSDMIHILNFSYDGVQGVSTLRHAANSMGLAQSAEASAKGFFSSGANMSGILTVTGKLTEEKATAIKTSWGSAFNIQSGTPGGIAVMESGLDFKPVTVNPKDAQMLETRQFNVLEVCRFFGVPPSKVFDQAGITYSNVEVYQLGFITDTITPFNSKIESEFNRKLFRPSQRKTTVLNMNLSDLLKANLDTKANYLSKMFQVGAFTVNEIREEIGNPKVDGGDESFVQVNLMPVNQKMKQPVKDQKLFTKTNINGNE